MTDLADVLLAGFTAALALDTLLLVRRRIARDSYRATIKRRLEEL